MQFSPDYILPELKATERYSAIRELLQYLIQVGAIPPQSEDSLFDALRIREEVMSTGVGFGIAIPHTSSDAVSKKVTILGTSKVGVAFSAMDGNPVKEVYLMISPVSEPLAAAEQDVAANP